jgi:hypothetical protein
MNRRGILSEIYTGLRQLRDDLLSYLPEPLRRLLTRSWLVADLLADNALSTGRWARTSRFFLLIGLSAVAWAFLATWKPVDGIRSLEWGLTRAQVEYVFCNVRNAISSNAVYNQPDNRCYSYFMARSFSFEPLFFELPLRLLFSAEYFRHVLMACLGIWLGFKAAAHYTTRLNNLQDDRLGEHFLLQTAGANPLNTIDIKDAQVPIAQQRLPVFRIGGPGMVRVHLENVAVFEHIDGSMRILEPTVTREPDWFRMYLTSGVKFILALTAAVVTGYSPLIILALAYGGYLGLRFTVMRDFIRASGGAVRLYRYDRLRKIIDLRDQQEKFDVHGRSRDGIHLEARDVQVVYRVNRNGQQPSLKVPYPFSNQAIRQLVYNQGKDPWQTAMAVGIQAEFRDFLGSHRLDQFLAMIDAPDSLRADGDMETTRQVAGTGGAVSATGRRTDGQKANHFVSRNMLTDRFYTANIQHSPNRGIELEWIGVGIWGGPVERMSGQHQEAWRITRQNEINRRPGSLIRVQNDSREVEFTRLVQTIALESYASLRSKKSLEEADLRESLTVYANHLREMLTSTFPFLREQLDSRIASLKQAEGDTRQRLMLIENLTPDLRDERDTQRLNNTLAGFLEEIDALQHQIARLEDDQQRIRRVAQLLTRYMYPWMGNQP